MTHNVVFIPNFTLFACVFKDDTWDNFCIAILYFYEFNPHKY